MVNYKDVSFFVFNIIIIVVLAFLVFTNFGKVEDSFNFSSSSYSCSDPFFNESDGYWYCPLDNFTFKNYSMLGYVNNTLNIVEVNL